MIARTLAAIALSAAICLPAAAQYDDSANINAAYERARGSGVTPVTTEEHWRCAAFWYVWSQFVEDEFGEAMRAKLDLALTKASALRAAVYWEDAVPGHSGTEEVDPEVQRIIQRHVDDAWFYGEGIVMGDDYGFAEILGSCALRAPE